MSSLAQELQDAREGKHITLQQISDLTLIDVEFLEAIEGNNLTFLPPAYVRAFIREYAMVVGIDSRRAMRLYDGELAQKEAAKGQGAEPGEVLTPGESRPRTSLTALAKSLFAQKPAWLVTIAIAIFTVIIVVLALQDRSPEVVTQEIPFQSIVQETQERIGGTIADQEDVQPTVQTTPADSLTLFAVITDSVWIQILIDNQEPREYLFPPDRRRSWRAREKFLVTLGNAGAVEFTLEGKLLGVMGDTGAVIRDIEFTRQMLNAQ
jgi:cytoskeletal protein RodZ